jgi:hypothetical protein
MSDPLELENYNRQLETVVALLSPKVRDRARDLLNQGGAKRIQLLTHVLSKEGAKRRSRAKWTALSGSLLLAGSLLAVARTDLFGRYLPALALSGLALVAFSVLVGRRPTRLEKAAREALLQSDEPESLGPLLERLPTLSPALRAQAYEQLDRLLPKITPDNFQKLTPAQRSSLYGMLNLSRHIDLDLRLSVLAALAEAGDQSCLGIVYMLANAEVRSDVAKEVREAARECIEHLFPRLDFGGLEDLPHHITDIGVEIRADKANFQNYATSFLTLSRLLPQLTPSNYKSVLSAHQRSQLYGLLPVYAAAGIVMYQYRRRNLHLEIVRTAERLSDLRALDALSEFADSSIAASDEELYTDVCRAIDTLEALEAQVERKDGTPPRARGAS